MSDPMTERAAETVAVVEAALPTCVVVVRGAVCAAGRHPTKRGMCARGHFGPGNSAALKTGIYAFRDRGVESLPSPLRLSVEEFRAQVLADRGGSAELSAIDAARIGHLAEVETTLRLLASDLARRGLVTTKGRVRSAFGKWLEALDRWQRLAAAVGDGHKSRQVPSLRDYLTRVTPTDEGGDV